MCYGSCPVYSVTLQRAGDAIYEGENFVDLVGPFASRIDQAAFADLALAFAFLEFAALNSTYAVDHTDAATTSIWTVSEGVRKQVDDYGDAGPRRLRTLEQLIDEAASELDWRPAGASSSDAEPFNASRFVLLPETGEPPHWTQRMGQFR